MAAMHEAGTIIFPKLEGPYMRTYISSTLTFKMATGLVLVLTTGLARAEVQQTLQTNRVAIQVKTLVEGLNHPWGIATLPSGRMLVTERSGTLRLVTLTGKKSAPIRGVPKVDARGQGGLLDVALHPDFKTNRLVYLSYAEPGKYGKNSTAVARGTLSPDGSALTNVRVIFSQRPKIASTGHFGSRLVFDAKKRLYITLGERQLDSVRGQAQLLTSDLGKVVRLLDDGSVPKYNPFVNNPKARPEIWSYGHRNVQGAALNPTTGKVWTIEHGPLGGDEINIPEAGKNYGWPVISFGVNYDGSPVGSGLSAKMGMEQPIYQWTPVIAPGGAIFYRGKMFPEWRGNLLVSGLKVTSLVRLTVGNARVNSEERMLSQLHLRIRDVEEGLDGALYVLTDENNGAVLKITRAKPPS